MVSSTTSSDLSFETASAQGSITSAGAGITGGYSGSSLTLKIFIAFFIGLSLYNALELLVLVFVTFKKFRGVYFWSLIVAGIGIIPYSLGFLVKFFQILDPLSDEGYVAVVLLTIGWYAMVTGQSVVLWSRLHLVVTNQRIIRWTLYMIIVDAVLLHFPTTVLTFGSNSNHLSASTLHTFVHGYNIMEKIQMVGFFVQELIISFLYIKETLKLLKASTSVKEEELNSRKIMNQLITINVMIVIMDCGLLAVEFANLYIIETTLKGVVYSVKLKLEFAVLSKLVQLVTTNPGSSQDYPRNTGLFLDKQNSNQRFPDFVDPNRAISDVTHAAPLRTIQTRSSRQRSNLERKSWLDEEMAKHNIEWDVQSWNAGSGS
ncbi:hypothetical protein AOQ84DRAFT_374324 [Glonium stellatum]|uniref:DUF7703 domain-containing protein n=1 Tax=Glonium stellatum TaxID=574774 RepID=A0A8E2JVW2_9PEZI|nr:hypothetical protein AOQ84DRAFT_374324 [Glonium stellatum]